MDTDVDHGSPTRTQPLAVRVHAQLRDRITGGDLVPGSALVQEQLATALGVSRTPVREALNRLVQDGLVDPASGGGFVVRDVADHEITDVHQVREALELMALGMASGAHTPLQLARLLVLVEEMAATDPTDTTAHFELNRRFHRGLVEPCGNAVLVGLIDQLWDHPINRRITRAYVLADPSNVEHMVAEHRRILQAAGDGDREALLELARAHMREGYAETRS